MVKLTKLNENKPEYDFRFINDSTLRTLVILHQDSSYGKQASKEFYQRKMNQHRDHARAINDLKVRFTSKL